MFKRSTFLISIILVSTFASCSSDSQNLRVSQYDTFSRFLKDRYMNPQRPEGFVYSYDSVDMKIFRLFIYRDTINPNPVVSMGDSVYIDFILSGFSSSSTSHGRSGVYYTNIPGLIVLDPGLNSQYWPKQMEGIKLGKTALVKGLELGLPGCLETDTVQFFVPSAFNYGGKQVGMVSADTPVIWTLILKKVVKENNQTGNE